MTEEEAPIMSWCLKSWHKPIILLMSLEPIVHKTPFPVFQPGLKVDGGKCTPSAPIRPEHIGWLRYHRTRQQGQQEALLCGQLFGQGIEMRFPQVSR